MASKLYAGYLVLALQLIRLRSAALGQPGVKSCLTSTSPVPGYNQETSYGVTFPCLFSNSPANPRPIGVPENITGLDPNVAPQLSHCWPRPLIPDNKECYYKYINGLPGCFLVKPQDCNEEYLPSPDLVESASLDFVHTCRNGTRLAAANISWSIRDGSQLNGLTGFLIRIREHRRRQCGYFFVKPTVRWALYAPTDKKRNCFYDYRGNLNPQFNQLKVIPLPYKCNSFPRLCNRNMQDILLSGKNILARHLVTKIEGKKTCKQEISSQDQEGKPPKEITSANVVNTTPASGMDLPSSTGTRKSAEFEEENKTPDPIFGSGIAPKISELFSAGTSPKSLLISHVRHTMPVTTFIKVSTKKSSQPAESNKTYSSEERVSLREPPQETTSADVDNTRNTLDTRLPSSTQNFAVKEMKTLVSNKVASKTSESYSAGTSPKGLLISRSMPVTILSKSTKNSGQHTEVPLSTNKATVTFLGLVTRKSGSRSSPAAYIAPISIFLAVLVFAAGIVLVYTRCSTRSYPISGKAWKKKDGEQGPGNKCGQFKQAYSLSGTTELEQKGQQPMAEPFSTETASKYVQPPVNIGEEGLAAMLRDDDSLIITPNPRRSPIPQASEKILVYISYSRHSTAHTESVVGFASWLRSMGIEAVCDLYYENEVSQNPPAFVEKWVNSAAFIIVISCPTYCHLWNTSKYEPQMSQIESPLSILSLTSFSNKNGKINLTNYEIFLLRNLLYQPERKPVVIPIKLVHTSVNQLHVMVNEELETPCNSVPVALQGFRMYHIGHLHENNATDQRDLLYRLYGKPLYSTNHQM